MGRMGPKGAAGLGGEARQLVFILDQRTGRVKVSLTEAGNELVASKKV